MEYSHFKIVQYTSKEVLGKKWGGEPQKKEEKRKINLDVAMYASDECEYT